MSRRCVVVVDFWSVSKCCGVCIDTIQSTPVISENEREGESTEKVRVRARRGRAKSSFDQPVATCAGEDHGKNSASNLICC